MKSDVFTTYESIIPSFYADVFKEKDLVERLLKGVDLVHMQVRKDTKRNASFASVLEPEPLQTTIVEKLTLQKSSRTTIAYGSGITYGTSNDYGDQAANPRDAYDLGDDSIKSIGYIADGIDNPSKIYTEGIDFYVDNGIVVFCKSLQSSDSVKGLFPDLGNTGSATFDNLIETPDIELVGYNVRRDKKELSRQFGYVLGVDAPPTTSGRDVFTGMWKLHTFGPSWFWTMFTLARALGTDVVRTKTEKVLDIKSTGIYGTVVITDKNTYISRSGSPPAVDTVIDFGYPVDKKVKVVHDLDANFGEDVPGVVYLDDTEYGSIAVFSSVVEPDEGNPTGSIYLRPSTLIVIKAEGQVSDEETSKLLDVFEEVLPKNTRVVIIFNISTKAADEDTGQRKPVASDVTSPAIIETAIIEGSTGSRTTAHKSKLRLSTR